MRVLGVDPGYDRVGVAIMEYENGNEVLLHSECIETDSKQETYLRIFAVGTRLQQLIHEHQVDTLGIETLFFNKNVKTAMSVAEARGVIMYVAQEADCQIFEFSPQQIKIAVSGYGNSDKTAVTAMVKQLIPSVRSGALDDEYDAIAVGITCLAHHGRSR